MRSKLTLLFLFISSSILLAQPESLNMELVGSWDDEDLPSAFYGSYNEVWGYTDCEGQEYAILGSSGFVHFFDLTDPANPDELERFEGGDVTIWRDIKSYQDHIYTVCDGCSEGMMIFDLSGLPNEVIKVDQTTEFFGNCHNIFIDEPNGRMYAAGTNTSSFGLMVFDIATNPDAPELIFSENLVGGYIHDLYVRDNIVYANSANNGLYIYDFSDVDDVQLLGTMTDYEEQGYNHSGWLTDDSNTLVMMDETFGTGIKLVDVSDFDDISVDAIFRSTLLAPDHVNSVGHNPYVRGDLAFISYYHDGVQVFDISDPENVENVAYYDTEFENTDYSSYTGNWGLYPYLSSGLILASDMSRGLQVLSMQNIDLQEVSPTLNPDVDLAFFDTIACLGETIELLTTGTAESYEWMISDAILPDTDAPTLEVEESGPYSVIASNQHCSVVTDEVLVTFTEAIAPSITLIDFTILESSVASSYQWYLDGVAIPGATEQTYEPQEDGLYTVEITDEFGCTATSEAFEVFIENVQELGLNGSLEVYPNPAYDQLFLEYEGEEAVLQYQVLDFQGRLIQTGLWNTSGIQELDIQQLSAGMYFVQLKDETGVYSTKFTKQ